MREVDRADAGVRHRGVHGHAVDVDGHPHHAHLRAHQLVAGLGNDRRVGGVALDQAGQRAVAGALLLDHRLQRDPRRRLVAQALQRAHRHRVGHDAGLHVVGAAPVQPVAVDPGLEGRARPQPLGADRHHVDVAVENQRAAAHRAFRVVHADDVAPTFVRDDRRRVARVAPQFVFVDRELAHGQAQRLELPRHQGLAPAPAWPPEQRPAGRAGHARAPPRRRPDPARARAASTPSGRRRVAGPRGGSTMRARGARGGGAGGGGPSRHDRRGGRHLGAPSRGSGPQARDPRGARRGRGTDGGRPRRAGVAGGGGGGG